tara:strand:+ start:1065 stop:1655 length:591 start_codon:yes stop_codon:yes gene_type:complete
MRFRKENKVIKLIKNILIVLSIFLIGCEDNKFSHEDINFEYNIDLPLDENGYYHLELGENWQTIQRLSATLTSKHSETRYEKQRDLVETIRVYWESSHYWVMDDTLGYIVKRGLTDDLEYVYYDTLSITGFEGEPVNTINFYSYPVKTGDTIYEINTMLGPVQTMVGDTMKIWTYFWDLNDIYIENTLNIILENNE